MKQSDHLVVYTDNVDTGEVLIEIEDPYTGALKYEDLLDIDVVGVERLCNIISKMISVHRLELYMKDEKKMKASKQVVFSILHTAEEDRQ